MKKFTGYLFPRDPEPNSGKPREASHFVQLNAVMDGFKQAAEEAAAEKPPAFDAKSMLASPEELRPVGVRTPECEQLETRLTEVASIELDRENAAIDSGQAPPVKTDAATLEKEQKKLVKLTKACIFACGIFSAELVKKGFEKAYVLAESLVSGWLNR